MKSKLNPRSRVYAALCHHVEEQINDWSYQNQEYGICPITEEKLTKKTAQVDHYPIPFIQIVDSWIELQELYFRDYANISKRWLRYNPTLKRIQIIEPSVRDGWREHHRKHAQYRYISASENRKTSDRGYRKSKKQKTMESLISPE